MALSFDHRTAPVRPTKLVALDEAVQGVSPADESVWLEWKPMLELRIRWEIRDDIHEAFMILASAIICWRRLNTDRIL
ncbi:hypothetical protein AB0M44_41135 [Streptosporangium subroseum]|uniref:hypothetical protein n=1 Tax=Streptosporangium subroseum TaxID=106412 RepID=UPI00341A6A95